MVIMKYLFPTFFTATVLYCVVHLSIFAKLIEIIASKDGGEHHVVKKFEATTRLRPDGGSDVIRIQQGTIKQKKPIQWTPIDDVDKKGRRRKNAMVLSVAPRTTKHVVALWSELECFTSDVDYVILSGPTWSEHILQHVVELAKATIPKFADNRITVKFQTSVNDRYDVGLWCDALDWMETAGDLQNFEQIELLNDSVFALRPYSSILSSLQEHNVSMTSLSYSLIRPEGTGPEMFWVESVWRGFNRTGIQTFKDYSCRPANDPMFCSRRWWGKKGCIVENFERNMVKQFPRDNVFGLFPSDVPTEMLTRKHNFPQWVRNPPYWQQLVEERGFPVSKVNWPEMIGSMDDDKLQTCTRFLDRSKLEEFDFSVAVKAI
ncbi:MAG: hypothetical protein SGILL_005058 [Bacillariaceae sp.]